MVVMAIAGMVRFGSLRKGSGASERWKTFAISPASGVRTKRQIRVTIVTDRTEEEKKMPRKHCRAARGPVERERQERERGW